MLFEFSDHMCVVFRHFPGSNFSLVIVAYRNRANFDGYSYIPTCEFPPLRQPLLLGALLYHISYLM